MNWARCRSMSYAIAFAWVTSFILSGSVSFAADQLKINASIQRAHGFLLKQKLTGPAGAIAALAFIKSGGDPKSPIVQEVLRETLRKDQTGFYVPLRIHSYEAAVDLMLLEAIDANLYRPHMQSAVQYLLDNQLSNGAWFYPDRLEPDCGDTSITQYAILGLWAGVRAGIDVPATVWEKAARWHIDKQIDDGGFAYHPFEKRIQTNPEERVSRSSMTSAGTSNLLIIRRILFGDAPIDSTVKPPVDSKRRFGVLERFVDVKVTAKQDVVIRLSQIDDALKKSVRWMISHLGVRAARQELYFSYSLYCIERVAALLDVDEFGGHDWYSEGANQLLMRQAADGSWTDECTTHATTALALLFLSKATTSIVAPKQRINLVGSGLQAGGRGLPDNLDAVEFKDGMVSTRKIVGPIDALLSDLERSTDAKVEDVQAAVVEAVQLDRPEELIGQIAQLRKLAVDSRVEVRRTALWALGRSGDISAIPTLMQGLADADLTVIREASLGLCILSRRPEGCGLAIDPTEDEYMGLKAEATDEEREKVFKEWQTQSKKRWTDWYHKNRLYDERDDKTTLRRTNK